MKRINNIISLGLLLLASMTSCDSILDKGPLDKFTNDNFWTSGSNVEGYANAFLTSSQLMEMPVVTGCFISKRYLTIRQEAVLPIGDRKTT